MSSKLLTATENNTLISLMKAGSTIQASAVVQLNTSVPPDHSKWEEKGIGVACLVRDAVRKSYYLQVLSISNKILMYEQELYLNFTFVTPAPNFMTFEANEGIVGFNFADDIESKTFCTHVENKLAERSAIKKAAHNKKVEKASNFKSTVLSLANIHRHSKSTSKAKSNRKSKIVISEPENFRHLNHIGFDAKNGFDLGKCDPSWKKLFNSLGLNQTALSDSKTSNFILQFVEENGGIDKLVQEIDQKEEKSKKSTTVKGAAPPPIAPRSRARKVPSKEPDKEVCLDDSLPPPPPPCPPSASTAGDVKPSFKPEQASIETEVLDETSNEPPSESSSNPLLAAISKGAALKKTVINEAPQEKEEEDTGFVSILAKRLAVMRLDSGSGSSSGEEAEEDEEWNN